MSDTFFFSDLDNDAYSTEFSITVTYRSSERGIRRRQWNTIQNQKHQRRGAFLA